MTSEVSDKSFKYWHEPLKWFGHFTVEWLYLKDVKNSKLKHIKSDVKAVVYLTDGK